MKYIKSFLQKFSWSRLLFSLIFSIALFYMNKIVFLGKVFNENYMDLVFFNEFKILLLLVPIIYVLLSFIENYFNNNSSKFIDKNQNVNIKHFVIITFFFLLFIYSIYYLTFYPGGVYIDTWTSFKMLNGTEPFSNHQPVLYTLSLGIVNLFKPDLVTGFGVYSFIQMVIMIAAFTYFIYWLLKKNVNKFLVTLTAFVLGFFPLFPMYSISIWKDTPFSLALFMYILTIIDLIIDFSNKNITIKNIVKLSIYTSLVVLFRNNGIYITFLCFIALILLFIKPIFKDKSITHIKSFAISQIITFIILVIIIKVIYPACGILPTEFEENLGIPLQQIARVVVTDGNITEDQKAIIEKILPYDRIKKDYQAMLVDNIKWDNQFNATYIKENKPEFFKLWFELLLQNPGEYIKAYLLQTSGFWTFNVKGEEAYTSVEAWGFLNEIVPNTDLIKQTFNQSFKDTLLRFPYYSAGLFFWITALSAFITYRTCKPKALLGYLPSMLLWLTIMVATPMAQALRYAYILVLMLPLNFLYPIIMKDLYPRYHLLNDIVSSTINKDENKVETKDKDISLSEKEIKTETEKVNN